MGRSEVLAVVEGSGGRQRWKTAGMLTVRVTAPHDLAGRLAVELEGHPTVSGLVRIPSVALDGAGDLLIFETAREDTDEVTAMFEKEGVAAVGGIVITSPDVVVSEAADAAERAAPGNPADGVIWEQVADVSADDARPSLTFYVFLLLATLIASIGRLLDQPILVVGAMVVGTDFAPVAALSYAITRRRWRMAAQALGTVTSGFALCAVIAWGLWSAVSRLGWITVEQATTGPQTAFIAQPDAWSFVVALLAGVAGVLAVTSAKSTTMVGAFISVTTVPAVGVLALTMAVGEWGEALGSLEQLAINVAGLVVAGVATLLVLQHAGPRIGQLVVRARRRRDRARAEQ